MKLTVDSLNKTKDFAAAIAQKISSERKDKATVLCLYGDLGSGKTTFVQFLAEELGISEPVTSPTFVIQKNFVIPAHPQAGGSVQYSHLIHIDCYRINDPAEMKVLRWNETMANPKKFDRDRMAGENKRIVAIKLSEDEI